MLGYSSRAAKEVLIMPLPGASHPPAERADRIASGVHRPKEGPLRPIAYEGIPGRIRRKADATKIIICAIDIGAKPLLVVKVDAQGDRDLVFILDPMGRADGDMDSVPRPQLDDFRT